MTMYADRQKEPPEIVMYRTLFNTASSAAPSDSNVLKDVGNESSTQRRRRMKTLALKSCRLKNQYPSRTYLRIVSIITKRVL